MATVDFAEGMASLKTIADKKSPEDIVGKYCGGCVRCAKRTRKGERGHHCMMQKYDNDIRPDDDACLWYWDRAEQEEIDRRRENAIEARRKELWAIYAEKPPIKLPIVYDGFGWIPECPVCGEMPHSMTQCHWCGQRYIQDDDVREYSKLNTELMECPNCHEIGEAHISKYSGHRRFHCEKCGCTVME